MPWTPLTLHLGRFDMSKKISFSKKMAVLGKTGGRCAYCGVGLDGTGFAVDHIHPQALGGRHEIDNLLPACPPCNTSKGMKTLEQFRLFSAVKRATGRTVFGQEQVEYLFKCGAFPALGISEEHRFFFESEKVN